jgi:hypothetical protein
MILKHGVLWGLDCGEVLLGMGRERYGGKSAIGDSEVMRWAGEVGGGGLRHGIRDGLSTPSLLDYQQVTSLPFNSRLWLGASLVISISRPISVLKNSS